ncbi:MAG: SPOR domain-containing protein [Rhodocyclales bacterium]|nr:SPOR domain-containing protein [Rhodocyclales bacterium]
MTTQEDSLERLRRIRRRFVGALVLLLAALITLPLVMEQKPKEQKAPVEVRIPARDQMPATVPPPAAVPEAAQPPEAELAEAPVAPPSLPAGQELPPPPPAEPSLKPAPPAGVATPKPAAPPEPSKPAPTVKPDALQEKARALAALEGALKPGQKLPGYWVVQAGAFRDEAKAKQVAGQLRGAGLDAFVEGGADGWYRVRIGPFVSEAKAQSAKTIAEQQRLSPRVVHVASP